MLIIYLLLLLPIDFFASLGLFLDEDCPDRHPDPSYCQKLDDYFLLTLAFLLLLKLPLILYRTRNLILKKLLVVFLIANAGFYSYIYFHGMFIMDGIVVERAEDIFGILVFTLIFLFIIIPHYILGRSMMRDIRSKTNVASI